MSSSTILSIISALGFLVHIGFEIALIVVALTTVRASRPDAAPLLAGAGGVQLFGSFSTYALAFLMPRLTGGMDQHLMGMAAQQGLGTMISSFAYVLLLLGIARLARTAHATTADPGRYV